MSWFRFKYNTWPRIKWYITGHFVWDFIHNWFHIRVMNWPEYWSDASQEECQVFLYCRYCSKGRKV